MFCSFMNLRVHEVHSGSVADMHTAVYYYANYFYSYNHHTSCTSVSNPCSSLIRNLYRGDRVLVSS